MKLNLPATTSEDDFVPFTGGFDQLTPSLSMPKGKLRDTLNFEASITGGYTRIAGYERHDGRTSPSDAIYQALKVNVTGTIAVGNTITGVTSAATGVVVYRSGTLVVYTKGTGTFVAAETLNVAASPQGTITEIGGFESDADFDVRMRYLAGESYRADIQAVPGSGPTRGVVFFGGSVYAFRNNAGGTAGAIYKATAGGWTLVPLLRTVAFTAGSVAPTEGGTITQGANSATVRRVCLESGSWGGGTAAGNFIVTTPAPGEFTAGALTGGGTATLSGASTAITILPDGNYEFDIGTVDNAPRVYGTDGVNKAFEFDGVTYAPINWTEAGSDRVMVHQSHLFVTNANSVQISGIGNPHTGSTTLGAGELLADGDVTVLQRMPGDQGSGSALIGHETGSHVLYGSAVGGSNPFRLTTFEDSSGMKARTAQKLGQVYVLDERGVMPISTTQAFGDFSGNSITLNIRPWLQARRTTATGSAVNREKNQYRLFFSDGSALYITMNGRKVVGCMPMQFPDVVRCVSQGEAPDGTEVMYFGGDNGYVYKLDSGTSFDGDAIDYRLRFWPVFQQRPQYVKRYRRASIEVLGNSYSTFEMAFEFAYGEDRRAQHDGNSDVELNLQSARWDEFTWDAFTWDGNDLSPTSVDIGGSGENIILLVRGSSAYYEPFTINSALLTYSVRRRMR